MLWFYRRERDTLRVETRFDNQTAEYVLIIHWPDGPHEERFSTHAEFRESLAALETRLGTERSATDTRPKIFRDGWPDKRPTR